MIFVITFYTVIQKNIQNLYLFEFFTDFKSETQYLQSYFDSFAKGINIQTFVTRKMAEKKHSFQSLLKGNTLYNAFTENLIGCWKVCFVRCIKAFRQQVLYSRYIVFFKVKECFCKNIKNNTEQNNSEKTEFRPAGVSFTLRTPLNFHFSLRDIETQFCKHIHRVLSTSVVHNHAGSSCHHIMDLENREVVFASKTHENEGSGLHSKIYCWNLVDMFRKKIDNL